MNEQIIQEMNKNTNEQVDVVAEETVMWLIFSMGSERFAIASNEVGEIINEDVSCLYKDAKPGDFVLMDAKKGLYIKTIDGIISALEVQPENSRKMSFSDFLRGLH